MVLLQQKLSQTLLEVSYVNEFVVEFNFNQSTNQNDYVVIHKRISHFL